MARKSKRNNRKLRTKRTNKTESEIRLRTARIHTAAISGTAADKTVRFKEDVVALETVVSVAVAPSPTGRKLQQRKTPVDNKLRSDVGLRVRCKDRPRDNRSNGNGSGVKKFVPWC
jgi:hypothetical protein